MSVTIRIAERTHETLSEIARKEGKTLQAAAEDAVEAFRRQRLLADANVAFAALRANPAGWNEEVAERTAWDAALTDDVEEDA